MSSDRKNPLKNDPVLRDLLSKTAKIKSDDDFRGWKKSFLNAYEQYLDPNGTDNAHNSEKLLLNSLKKLSGTVLKVNGFVDDGTITKDRVGVKGQKSLKDMTDQMASTEKALHRFLPTTKDHEDKVGYNKFELGAVMIKDGFEVWEILRSTRDIIVSLRAKTLKDVCSADNMSIIDFYLRQVQSFAEVLADLGLYAMMEHIIEMYKVMPRGTKTKKKPPTPAKKKKPVQEKASNDDLMQSPFQDSGRKFNNSARAILENGYISPLDLTASPTPQKNVRGGNDENNGKNEGEGGGESHSIVYFDMKTGKVGTISRSKVEAKGVIVKRDKKTDEEVLEGEITDQNAKEDLLWTLKKALKKSNKK